MVSTFPRSEVVKVKKFPGKLFFSKLAMDLFPNPPLISEKNVSKINALSSSEMSQNYASFKKSVQERQGLKKEMSLVHFDKTWEKLTRKSSCKCHSV